MAQAEHEVLATLMEAPAAQSDLHPVMSSLTADPYCPTGQASQAVASENGFKLGCAMNVPAEQHPKRPVDVKPLIEDGPAKDSHLPPHNVRVKPLWENTFEREMEH